MSKTNIQKPNFIIDLEEEDYEYLRPPIEVFDIRHPHNYIIKGEGKKATRKIYKKCEFTPFEKQAMKDFRKVLDDHQIKYPSNWDDIMMLKLGYSKRFDYKKCLEVAKAHLEWLNDPATGKLTEPQLQCIKDGLIYVGGRAKGFRPVIVADIAKVDLKKYNIDDFAQALVYILNMARKYCYVDYHVENWVIIVETGGAGVFDFPRKVISKLVGITTNNYLANLDKMYITNPSSTLKFLFDFIKGMIDPETAAKISMVRKKDFHEIQEKIDIDQVEERFGGTMPNRTSYWPPFTTLKAEPWTVTLRKREEEKKRQEEEAERKALELAERRQKEEMNRLHELQEQLAKKSKNEIVQHCVRVHKKNGGLGEIKNVSRVKTLRIEELKVEPNFEEQAYRTASFGQRQETQEIFNGAGYEDSPKRAAVRGSVKSQEIYDSPEKEEKEPITQFEDEGILPQCGFFNKKNPQQQQQQKAEGDGCNIF